MKRSKLYSRIVERLPDIVTEEYGRDDVCIPASYHALEILRQHGIPASLAVMGCTAANRVWWEWITTDPGSEDSMPDDAWSVAIGHRNPNERDGGFNGHVVVRSKGWTIDCSAGAMSRPQRGIVIPPGLLCRGNTWHQGETVVLYYPSPLDVPPMWQNAPDATAHVRKRCSAVLS